MYPISVNHTTKHLGITHLMHHLNQHVCWSDLTSAWCGLRDNNKRRTTGFGSSICDIGNDLLGAGARDGSDLTAYSGENLSHFMGGSASQKFLPHITPHVFLQDIFVKL